MSLLLKGVIRGGRVELDNPIEWPDGTEVVVASSDPNRDDHAMSPAEIARVLEAMQLLEPLEIPDDVAADLDAWEKRIEQYGIDRLDSDDVPR